MARPGVGAPLGHGQVAGVGQIYVSRSARGPRYRSLLSLLTSGGRQAWCVVSRGAVLRGWPAASRKLGRWVIADASSTVSSVAAVVTSGSRTPDCVVRAPHRPRVRWGSPRSRVTRTRRCGNRHGFLTQRSRLIRARRSSATEPFAAELALQRLIQISPRHRVAGRDSRHRSRRDREPSPNVAAQFGTWTRIADAGRWAWAVPSAPRAIRRVQLCPRSERCRSVPKNEHSAGAGGRRGNGDGGEGQSTWPRATLALSLRCSPFFFDWNGFGHRSVCTAPLTGSTVGGRAQARGSASPAMVGPPREKKSGLHRGLESSTLAARGRSPVRDGRVVAPRRLGVPVSPHAPTSPSASLRRRGVRTWTGSPTRAIARSADHKRRPFLRGAPS